MRFYTVIGVVMSFLIGVLYGARQFFTDNRSYLLHHFVHNHIHQKMVWPATYDNSSYTNICIKNYKWRLEAENRKPNDVQNGHVPDPRCETEDIKLIRSAPVIFTPELNESNKLVDLLACPCYSLNPYNNRRHNDILFFLAHVQITDEEEEEEEEDIVHEVEICSYFHLDIATEPRDPVTYNVTAYWISQ